MKKLLLAIIFFAIALPVMGQRYVGYERWGKYTDAEMNAINTSNPDEVYKVYNTTQGKWKCNDGGAGWVDCVTGGGTDDQIFTDFSLSGNTLSITIENGNTVNVDLSTIVGNVTISDFSLSGNNLTLELSNGSSQTVDLTSIASGASTLDDLADVITAGANSGEVLKFNGTNWVPGTDNNSGGGAGVPNSFTPSTQSELTDAGNAGKTAFIANDIVLTSDIALASGLTLHGVGGTISGNYTITLNGSQKMISSDVYGTIIDCSEVTLEGGMVHGWYSANWFGLVDTNDSALFDNYPILKEALDMMAVNGGTLQAMPGYYYLSTTEENAGSLNWWNDTALTVREGVHFTGSGMNNTTLRLLGNNLFDFAMLYAFTPPETFAYNIKISDIWLHGEEMEHDYSVGGIQDRGHLIQVHGAVALEGYNIKGTHSKADAIIWETFTDLGGASLSNGDFETGSINTSTGANTSDSRMKRMINLSTISAKAQRMGYGYITGGSYGNSTITGTLTDNIGVYFYNASDTFLSYAEVNSYEAFVIPENATQFKLVLDEIPSENPFEGATLEVRLRYPDYNFRKGSKIYNNVFDLNRRNHISNLAPGTEVFGNSFLRLGASDSYWAGPGYAIGPEDGYGMLNGLNIHDNYAKGAIAGFLNARFVKDVIIANNIVDRNVNDTLVDGTVLPTTGSLRTTGIRDCRNCQINGGVYKETSFNLGRGNQLSDVTMYEGEIILRGRNASASNIKGYNIKLRGDDTVEGIGYFSDVDVMIDRSDHVSVFQTLNNSVLDNIHVRFEKGLYFDASPPLSGDFGTSSALGSINRLTMENVVAASGQRNNRGAELPAIPISHSEFTTGVIVGTGIDSTRVLKYDDNDFRWLRLELDNYPNTGETYFPVEISDSRLTTAGDGTLIGGSDYLFETPEKDIDLVVENSCFVIDVASENALIQMLHTGYSYFFNTCFESVDPITINLNTLAPNTDVTFENCKFKNVTFTLKAGDANNNPWTIPDSSDGAGATLPTEATFIMVGASIVQDVFADTATTKSLIESTYSGTTVTVYEDGTDGWTSQDLNDNIGTILDSYTPTTDDTYVFVHVGGNDVSQNRPYSTAGQSTLDEIEQNIINVLDSIESRGYTPILSELTFRDYDDTTYNNQEDGSAPFNENIIHPLALSRSSNFTYSDGTTFNQWYNTMWNNRDTWLSADNIHPESAGVTGLRAHFVNTIAYKIFTGLNPTKIELDATDTDNDGNPDYSDPNTSTAVAQNDAFTAFTESATAYNILANDDFLPSANITITDLGTGTAAGTISFNNLTGEMTYTSTLGEEGGSVTVDYQVEYDPSGVTGTATVTINVSAGFDADAQAYIDAVGTLTTAEQTAINDLVVNLKANGTWSKYYAIYPFIGGTALEHQWNLKDPRDLDAAYRLTFGGTITHSETGAAPDGSTGYADTHFNASTTATLGSVTLGFYSGTNSIINGDYDIGASITDRLALSISRTSSEAEFQAYSFSDGTSIATADNGGDGYFVGSRRSVTDATLWRKGVEIGSSSFDVSGQSQPNGNLYLFAYNLNGSASAFSNRQCRFAVIGQGLTDTELADDYADIQAFQTALSRNID